MISAGCKHYSFFFFFFETRTLSRDMTDCTGANQTVAVCHADSLRSLNVLFCNFLAGEKNLTLFRCCLVSQGCKFKHNTIGRAVTSS